jgi:hypothetical protein
MTSAAAATLTKVMNSRRPSSPPSRRRRSQTSTAALATAATDVPSTSPSNPIARTRRLLATAFTSARTRHSSRLQQRDRARDSEYETRRRTRPSHYRRQSTRRAPDRVEAEDPAGERGCACNASVTRQPIPSAAPRVLFGGGHRVRFHRVREGSTEKKALVV